MEDNYHLENVGDSRTELSPGQIKFEEGPWQRRSKLEKCLIVLVILLLILLVIFLVLFLVFYFKEDDKDDSVETCSNPDCLQAAASISMALDPKTNPCDDFYQFACGGWDAEHPIPLDKSQTGPFNINAQNTQKMLLDLLTKEGNDALPAIQKARTLFKSCENLAAIDKKGTEPMLELLRTAGDKTFPTLEENWADNGWNLTQVLTTVGAVGNLGTTPLILWRIEPDLKQSTKRIITMAETPLVLGPRILYEDENAVSKLYQDRYVPILVLLGANNATASEDAKALAHFEFLVAMATAPLDQAKSLEKRYHKTTIKNLTNTYPMVDWLDYMQNRFTSVGITLTEEEEVMILAQDYYDRLFPIIANTSSRTLLNYGMWTIVYKYADLLNQPFRDLMAQFAEKGRLVPERWKVCVDKTVELLPDAVGRLFVDHTFPPEYKDEVLEMIHNLVDAFKEIVNEEDWLTKQTKQAAQDKADAISYEVGYPNSIMNDTFLSQTVENVDITGDDYFQNNMNILRHTMDVHLRSLRQPVDKAQWTQGVIATSMGAFYILTTNAVYFPASIRNKPFFSEKYISALNYGAIGYAVGHEVTHGFDDNGRTFDKAGNLGSSWWEPEDLVQYNDRKKCLVNQYGNFVDPALNQVITANMTAAQKEILKKTFTVNGNLTLSENIADNGGMKEAFRAYRDLVAQREKEDPRLPGLDYSPDQLFFISAAQVWCSNTALNRMPLLDNHSPARFRVIGTLQNNEEFARVFNCPVGSYMNPEKKCHVW